MPEWNEAIRARLKALHLDGVREAEVVEELSEHLDDRYRELVESGMDRDLAARAAIEELESQDLLKTSRRRARRLPAIGAGGGYDLKIALRMIRMKPAFSAAVIGMLALGVAGNAAIFSIFNGLFLRPLPFANSERLVDLDETAPKWNLKYTGVAVRDYVEWQKSNTTFDGMAFFSSGGANVTTANGGAQRIRSAAVTYNLLDVLGLKPVIGRTFTAEEDRAGGPRVVMLGYELWQRMFNGDRNVLGQIVKADDVGYTVVGVLPREAVLPDAEAWTPLAPDLTQNGGWFLSGAGRLKHGVTVQQANDDLLRIHRGLIATGRKVNEITSPAMVPLRERYLGDFRPVARMLLAAVGVVLLIACVNIAGLMLVRCEARSREIAIRTAVGASRGRVIRQLLTESATLAAAGGLAGVLLGKLFLNGLVSMMPDNMPKWIRFDLDWRFALFCVAATGASAILFGLAPALQASAVDLRGGLQETARATFSRGRRAVLSVLVAAEIALALALLITSGLVVQAFRKVLNVDPGYRPGNVMTFSVRLPNAKYENAKRLPFFTNFIERLKNVPGVAAVSAASIIPLNGHQGNFFEVEGGRQLGATEQNPVTLTISAIPGYFEAMGMTFLHGRGFKDADQQKGAQHVAIVNETYAKYFWGFTDVTGKRLRYNGAKDWMVVAGVIRDTRHYGLDGVMRPSVFVPYADAARPQMTIVMRGAADAATLVSPAREILRQLDADLPMYDVRSMTERLERSLWARRAYSSLIAAFAVVAMVLATAGIYGVISFAVSQRTREIGIRMALGARPGQVMGGVLRSGMILVTIGVAGGIAAALFTGQFLETLLFGVSPRDAGTYVAVTLGVVVVGLIANYVPARRASEVDPMRVLRAE